MESAPGNNHGFLDGNKTHCVHLRPMFSCGAMVSTSRSKERMDTPFINGSMERNKFRFAEILDWIQQHISRSKSA